VQRLAAGAAACLGGVLVLSSTAAAQTVPPGYEIVDITSNNGRLEQFPRINNNGQVVFHSRIFPGNFDSDIFMYDGRSGELTQITNDGPNDVFDGLADIADDGTIVWSRWSGPNVGNGPTPEIMMRTPDGVVTQITDDDQEDWGPSINNHRQVVWKKKGPEICPGIKSMEIYMYDGSQTIRLTTSGEMSGYANQGPEINDFGDIVWTEYDFCDPPFPYTFTSRIMLYRDGDISALPLVGVSPQEPAINEQGWVAWSAIDPALLRDTVELWNGVTSMLLTDDGYGPDINDHGHIAFSRWDRSANLWRVWLYRDGVFTLLTDEPVHNAATQINDRDEIVWSRGAQLTQMDVRLLRRHASGDLNCDRVIDAFDIEPFVVALLDAERYVATYPWCDCTLADVNEDGVVDSFDIEPFVELLLP
jgi:hypothetical protein